MIEHPTQKVLLTRENFPCANRVFERHDPAEPPGECQESCRLT